MILEHNEIRRFKDHVVQNVQLIIKKSKNAYIVEEREREREREREHKYMLILAWPWIVSSSSINNSEETK